MQNHYKLTVESAEKNIRSELMINWTCAALQAAKTHTTASTDPHRTHRIISNAYMRCELMTLYECGHCVRCVRYGPVDAYLKEEMSNERRFTNVSNKETTRNTANHKLGSFRAARQHSMKNTQATRSLLTTRRKIESDKCFLDS
uniref:SFRICE_034892 n=1 Tax=Spodoptera frugiperda TaxID=7108 RepID=A0A2H1VCH4_SPOFR